VDPQELFRFLATPGVEVTSILFLPATRRYGWRGSTRKRTCPFYVTRMRWSGLMWRLERVSNSVSRRV